MLEPQYLVPPSAEEETAKVVLLYATAWQPAVIRYRWISPDANGDWCEDESTSIAGQEDKLQKFCLNIPSGSRSLEFVIRSMKSRSDIDVNGAEYYWDNPSLLQNYLLDLPAVVRREYLALLSNGVIHHCSSNISEQDRPQSDLKLADRSRRHLMLVTDLDGTLLGDDEATQQFMQYWLTHRRKHAHANRYGCKYYVENLIPVARFHADAAELDDRTTGVDMGSTADRDYLIYSTGRNLKSFLEVAAEKSLIEPDYLVCGVGTEIYIFEQDCESRKVPNYDDFYEVTSPELKYARMKQNSWVLPSWYDASTTVKTHRAWEAQMKDEINRVAVERATKEAFPHFTINGNEFYDPFRLSILIEADRLPPIKELKETYQGLDLVISGYGMYRFLDVLPPTAGKRGPLEKLQEAFRGAGETQSQINVLVCGDSANDFAMFTLPDSFGCVVGNVQSGLRDALYGKSNDVIVLNRKYRVNLSSMHFSEKKYAGAILDTIGTLNLEKRECVNYFLAQLNQ